MKNVINIFYIANGILQTFPAISTNSPLASLIPVAYVIILGMILEAVSDLRRWSNDRKINNQKMNKLKKTQSGIESY